MKYRELISGMSLEDKVALCSGRDFWRTKAFAQYGIPSIMLSDGPHGLRKQENVGDHMGVKKSVPATCFPASCALGSSWDRELVKRVAEAIAREALQEDVAVILGPGINIKRNPLCGRNFEYYSEDPYLAGELAASFIQGAEGQGVGTSLKHFAANSQETKRFTSDSIVDDRSLREIYLTAFEKAVKQGKPSTVMCAYNKINGIYCSDNSYLSREILREEWGFQGVVVTDWGAMNDRVAAFQAGTDLEMPGGASYFDKEVIAAVKGGQLPEERIDEAVNRILTLVFRGRSLKGRKTACNPDTYHELARKAAAESAVLLKNEGKILPLDRVEKVAVIGSMGEKIRYQGSGSSHINPTKLTNLIQGLESYAANYVFCQGCNEDGSTDDTLLSQAVQVVKDCNQAVVLAGLPDFYESEGFDRESMALPEGHTKMIQAVAKANPNIVVVLMAGAAVTMPWLSEVKAVLHMHLPGQAGGQAAADLLYGRVNPSGKLTETYPLSYEDVPSSDYYEEGREQAQYREGIYVGYRYYDKAGIEVCFPFGHGLSYTTFSYSNLQVEQSQDCVQVSVTIMNTGKLAGGEVVQLYVGNPQGGVHRPHKELKGFHKVYLEAGEAKVVSFALDNRSFSYYDVKQRSWQVQRGSYSLQIGASSRDIRLHQILDLAGTIASVPVGRWQGTWYEHLQGKPGEEDLETLLGKTIPEPRKIVPKKFSMEHSIVDMQGSWVMRAFYKIMEKVIGKQYGGVDYSNANYRMSIIAATEVPLKNMCIVSGGLMKKKVAQGMVHMANGKYFKGLFAMVRKDKEG